MKQDTCVPSNNIPSTCTRDFKHFDSSVWSPLQFKKYQSEPFNSQDLIINCPLLLLQISCKLVDRFEYSHYLFARYLMDISGRNFMLITSGSYIVEKNNHPYIYTKCAFYI